MYFYAIIIHVFNMDEAGAIFKIMICVIQYKIIFFSSTKNNVEPKKNNKRKARKTRNIKRDKKIARKKQKQTE